MNWCHFTLITHILKEIDKKQYSWYKTIFIPTFQNNLFLRLWSVSLVHGIMKVIRVCFRHQTIKRVVLSLINKVLSSNSFNMYLWNYIFWRIYTLWKKEKYGIICLFLENDGRCAVPLQDSAKKQRCASAK